MTEIDPKATATRALTCLDLTDLNDDCADGDIRALAAKGVTPHGKVAALCVWPRFVALARRLADPEIKIATVVAFPGGDDAAETAIDETEAVIRDGADEIDVVIPYRALMEGRDAQVTARVERVKRAAFSAPVKAILETGVLETPEMTRRAADLALQGGADFLKTSTGKVPVNATLGAAQTLLTAIKESGRPGVGFKAAGGIRTAEDAAAYLALADEIMGEGWAGPATFRFGASGLLDALLAEIEGGAAAPPDEGY
ncbi:MAG: deoxyribose-phosphate aldolase [Pseudomonadota bacterium]